MASSSCSDIQASAVVTMANMPANWPGAVPHQVEGPSLEYLNLEQNMSEMNLHGQKPDERLVPPVGARPKTSRVHK